MKRSITNPQTIKIITLLEELEAAELRHQRAFRSAVLWATLAIAAALVDGTLLILCYWLR